MVAAAAAAAEGREWPPPPSLHAAAATMRPEPVSHPSPDFSSELGNESEQPEHPRSDVPDRTSELEASLRQHAEDQQSQSDQATGQTLGATAGQELLPTIEGAIVISSEALDSIASRRGNIDAPGSTGASGNESTSMSNRLASEHISTSSAASHSSGNTDDVANEADAARSSLDLTTSDVAAQHSVSDSSMLSDAGLDSLSTKVEEQHADTELPLTAADVRSTTGNGAAVGDSTLMHDAASASGRSSQVQHVEW